MNRVDAHRVGDHEAQSESEDERYLPRGGGCVGTLLGVWDNIVPGDHP